MGTHSTRHSAEVRERAVRLVFDHQGEHVSQWEAISSIASKIGCTAETLRRWVRQAERDSGARAGTTTEERGPIRALEREVRELRQPLEPIGNIPPAEAEERYGAMLEETAKAAQLKTKGLRQTRRGSSRRVDQYAAQALGSLRHEWDEGSGQWRPQLLHPGWLVG